MIDPDSALDRIRDAGLLRELRLLRSGPGPRVRVGDAEVLLLCSNDYLGLAEDPRVRQAAAAAAEEWGAGAGASRLVAGSTTLHAELEEDLASFCGSEAALLFGSGFLANTGVIAALAEAGELLLSDSLNHASIVDGCRLSRAETVVYPHCDLDAVEAALKAADGRRATIVTDAVFSMDGDLAPLVELAELGQRYGAGLIVDEAHGTGVVGATGRGLVVELGLEGQVDVVVGTLSKALGSYGAFAACSRPMVNVLVNRARTFIFSTALPPPAVAAASEALRVLRHEPELVQRLHENASALRAALRDRGFDVPPGEMPIVPLVVGEPEDAMRLCSAVLDRGVFAQAIRPPTVPHGTSRLRLVAMASHDRADLELAADAISTSAAELQLRFTQSPEEGSSHA